MFLRKVLFLFTALTMVIPCAPRASAEFGFGYTRYQEPEFLTYEELIQLSIDPAPGGTLGKKLEKFWVTPIISNEAWHRGSRPRKLMHPNLGQVIRIGSWNIEKSFEIPRIISMLSSEEAYTAMLPTKKYTKGKWAYSNVLRQRRRLLQADILILQEMDIGIKRSGYLNAPAKLAEVLDMNYAYGASQLEIDPIMLGTEEMLGKNGKPDKEATELFKPDPVLYKGVFGSAVLSRYPIKNVQLFQLKKKAYDWYWQEKSHIAFLEKTRRVGTKLLFKNHLNREIKVGGRNYLRVDLEVPELPGKTLTIINIHLEIKCQPLAREEQVREILSYIGDIRNPVVVMGDFNAAPTDISPTSITRVVSRTAKDPSTWVNAAVTFLTPYGPVNTARGIGNVGRTFHDPTAKNVPFLGANPVKPMFELIENFRFTDGSVFDFRGDRDKSVNGKRGTLANSNQRGRKGFKTTFRVKRPIGPWLGKLRLDWAFVKSTYLKKDPRNEYLSYRLAPHFGETLEEFNTAPLLPFSDHHPNVFDLPLNEPKNAA